MARIRPQAVIDQTIGDHSLYAEKWNDRWLIVRCELCPDLAKQHEGAEDLSPLIDAFERLAAEASKPPAAKAKRTLFDDCEPQAENKEQG